MKYKVNKVLDRIRIGPRGVDHLTIEVWVDGPMM